MDLDKLLGRNPVLEAFRSGRKIYRITLLTETGKGKLKEIADLAAKQGIPVEYASRRELDAMVQGANHQGVVAEVMPVETVDVEELLLVADSRKEPPLLLLLDEIQDPHNLGSLLRSADAFGFHGIVIPKRRSVGLTPTVAKISAGAVEYVKVAEVSNLAQCVERLKEKGLWIAGADMAGEAPAFEQDLTGPLALVLGGEGKGLGRLIKEKCDFLVHIPMWGQINSLNVSVAGGILMYEVQRQRNLDKGN